MAYVKINVLTELRKMAKGRPTRVHPRVVAAAAVEWVKAGLAGDEVERLEQLFRLTDSRD
jgi:hypothetical protein